MARIFIWIQIIILALSIGFILGTATVSAGIDFNTSSPLNLPEFTSNLEAEIFALKWYKDSTLRGLLEEKRKDLLDKVSLSLVTVEGWEYGETTKRKQRIEQADYLLRAIRTLDRDDFDTLLKAYSSSPVGASVYSINEPVRSEK